MPEDASDKTSQTASPGSSESSDDLSSLTRLVVGGVEIGVDELLLRLREWEIETDKSLTRLEKNIETASNPQAASLTQPNNMAEGKNSDLIRYALIGLLFESQGILQNSFQTLGKFERLVMHYADPIVKPVFSSRLFGPARNRYDRLVERGQQEVDRWIEIGREEEVRSRVYAQTAITGAVDDTIEYLADNEEIQELIEAQTTGLAAEMVEEVRERSVSMDILLEGMVRSLFRRTPRAKLPKPPLAIRLEGASLRPTKQYYKPRINARAR